MKRGKKITKENKKTEDGLAWEGKRRKRIMSKEEEEKKNKMTIMNGLRKTELKE